MEPITVSVVVPVYCGAAHLETLVEEVRKVKETWHKDALGIEIIEMILVDDSSVDQSFEVMNNLAAKYEWIKIIGLAGNFGQHPATAAGLVHSHGDFVITVDEDMQHPPQYFIKLMECALSSSMDVVYGKAVGRRHESFLRDFASLSIKGVLARLSGNVHMHHFSPFRLLRGDMARRAAQGATYDDFLDVVFTWYTNRITSCQLPLKDHRHIKEGGGGYTFKALYAFTRRLFISSNGALIRLVFVMLGLFLAASYTMVWPMVYDGYSSYLPMWGWGGLFTIGLLFVSSLSFLLYLCADSLASLIRNVNGRPAYYVIDRTIDKRWQKKSRLAPK